MTDEQMRKAIFELQRRNRDLTEVVIIFASGVVVLLLHQALYGPEFPTDWGPALITGGTIVAAQVFFRWLLR